MFENFITLQSKRHTIIDVGNNVPYTDQELIENINKSIMLSPTAFNNKSVKAIVLTDTNNQLFWTEAMDLWLLENKISPQKNKLYQKK